MKTLLNEIRISVLATLVVGLIVCGLYPVVVWAGAQLLFRDQADGSLVVDGDGTVRGSRLLAQSFTSPRYFHPRPSAAGAGYDATSSGGTNLGPTSRKLAEAVKAAVAAYRVENRLPADAPVPADAVTSSGSGLDPHISPANAAIQARRVALTRGWPLERVQRLIGAATDRRTGNVLGEPGVNVLMLNRALDAAR